MAYCRRRLVPRWLLLLLLGLVCGSSANATNSETNSSSASEETEEELPFANPYHKGGCLWNRRTPIQDKKSGKDDDEGKLKNWQNKLRVCHSEDPPEAAARGLCRPSPMEDYYMELRVEGLGWGTSRCVVCAFTAFSQLIYMSSCSNSWLYFLVCFNSLY